MKPIIQLANGCAVALELGASDQPAPDAGHAAARVQIGAHGERSLRFRHTYRRHRGEPDAHCNVVVFEHPHGASVLFAQVDDNPGCSVTNAIELLACEIHTHLLQHVPAGDITWLELYHRGLPGNGPTLDHVELDHTTAAGKTRFFNPRWTRIAIPTGAAWPPTQEEPSATSSTAEDDHQLPLGLRLSRAIGAAVCRVLGHEYFYPLGEVTSWSAYSCVRCNALSRPLEDLPYAPGWDDEDYGGYNDRFSDPDVDERIEREWAISRRWVSWLPWPRWS